MCWVFTWFLDRFLKMPGVPSCCNLAPTGGAACLKHAELNIVSPCRINLQTMVGVISVGPGAEQKGKGCLSQQYFFIKEGSKSPFTPQNVFLGCSHAVYPQYSKLFVLLHVTVGCKLLWSVNATFSSNSTFKSSDFWVVILIKALEWINNAVDLIVRKETDQVELYFFRGYIILNFWFYWLFWHIFNHNVFYFLDFFCSVFI